MKACNITRSAEPRHISQICSPFSVNLVDLLLNFDHRGVCDLRTPPRVITTSRSEVCRPRTVTDYNLKKSSYIILTKPTALAPGAIDVWHILVAPEGGNIPGVIREVASREIYRPRGGRLARSNGTAPLLGSRGKTCRESDGAPIRLLERRIGLKL